MNKFLGMAYVCRLLLLVVLIEEYFCDQMTTFQVFILKSCCVTAFTATDNDDQLLFLAVIKRDGHEVQPGSFFTVDSFEAHRGNLLKFGLGSVPTKCTGYSRPSKENQNGDGSCADLGTLLFIYLNVNAGVIKGLGPITGTWITTNSNGQETKLESTIDTLPSIIASDNYVLTVEDRVVPEDEEFVYFRLYNVIHISMCVENYSGKDTNMYLGDQLLSINGDANCANFSIRASPDTSGTQLFIFVQELDGKCQRRRVRKLILMQALPLAYNSMLKSSKASIITYRSSNSAFFFFLAMFIISR